MGATCASYTIQHSVHIARAEVCGGTSISNHLRKVGRHRSAFDENKRNVKVSGSQPRRRYCFSAIPLILLSIVLNFVSHCIFNLNQNT